MKIIFSFRVLFLVCCVVCTVTNSRAQAPGASIRGFVYEKETGEPVIFTTVYLKGTSYGSATDVNGFYSITKLPPGEYILAVSCLGFDSLQTPVSVKAGEIFTKKIFLTKKSVELKGVDISAEKEEKKNDVRISITKVTSKEIKQLPSVGGEPDLAQYLQVLPGVVFTGDQGGQLYIRGGSPIQNKVLLDGMVIYNPFHSIGLFSVFDADVIRNADVYTGGFSADYGGRISSIMDITTRDGNKKRISGKISGSPFTSKMILEGPIKKAKEEGDGTASFLFNAKTSYLQQSSKIFYQYVDTAGLPYNFTDYYGKMSFNGANGSKLNLFGFNFADDVNYQHVSRIQWKSKGFGSNFVLIPGGSPVLLEGNFAYSNYGISMQQAGQDSLRESDIRGFNMGLTFTYFLAKDELKYGVEILGFRTNFEFYNAVNAHIQQVENTTELGSFVKYKKVWNKLLVEPGFRLQYYGSLSEASPEPRLGAKYNISDKFRLKFAGGYYSQNLISASSDRDVVNLFYGFLSGSDNLPRTFDGKEVTSKLQKARHAILGLEWDLPSHFDLNIEGYVKDFTQLSNLNRDKIYEDNEQNALKPDYQKKDFIIETGKATGVDMLVKYDYKRFYFWVVYSLSFVTRYDGIHSYMPHFDRRHNVNIVGTYSFGRGLWELDGRWNFGSGFPFTQTAGYYEFLDFSAGLNTNITNANGTLKTIYGELNAGHLPYYHRLDISLKRKWELSKNSTLEAVASVINAYGRKNIFYYNRITNEEVYQLPVLPSLGLSLTF